LGELLLFALFLPLPSPPQAYIHLIENTVVTSFYWQRLRSYTHRKLIDISPANALVVGLLRVKEVMLEKKKHVGGVFFAAFACMSAVY
jgi:hypothetical protein